MGTKQKTVLKVLFLMSLVGCQFSKDRPHTVSDNDLKAAISEAEQQRKDALSGFLSEKDVTVTYEELPEPGSYRVILAWEKIIPYLVYTVRGSTSSLANATSISFSALQPQDRVDIETKNNLGLTVSKFQITTKPPRDIVLTTHALSEDTVFEANRVFLSENSKIVTEGFNLTIIANKLIVMGEKATLSTLMLWSADMKTKDPVHQKNSTINLQTRSIHGTLDIYLYGLNGQDGRNGIELEESAGIKDPAIGPTGADGQIASSQKCAAEDLLIPGDIPCTGDAKKDYNHFCVRPAGNGGDGEDAVNAMDGENGYQGANTGDLIVNAEKIDGRLDISYIVGRGGRGGAPAPVRPGGLGGQPGAYPNARVTDVCPAAQGGKPGKTGLPGKQGTPGPNGKLGSIILPSKPEIREKISIIDMSRSM